jgi:FkbM family methyltransferase
MRLIHENAYRFLNLFMPLLYLRHIRQDTVIHSVNDSIKMKLRVGSFDKWATYQVWKFGDYKSKGLTIQPKDTIIDIGGHIGSFSIWAAKQANRGQVFTFEPNHENFGLLQENQKINNVSNLKVFNLAVADKAGEITLFNSKHQNMGHSFYENHLQNKTTVKTITLAEILESNKINKVDLLKVDAEGAEYPILLNTSPKVLQKINKIILEYHDYLNHGYNYQDIKHHLKSNGFEVEQTANVLQRNLFKIGLLKAIRKN